MKELDGERVVDRQRSGAEGQRKRLDVNRFLFNVNVVTTLALVAPGYGLKG